ncbi:hypothetical protein OSB04_015369 [Centaurea solstitialis]|uniref:non-specific serine/threonine protein kinase n=1 Tax=Centaurea solstitialis TaxID=347529 RepID=A0AA38SYW5_9ASTR|nr:hypothetical protein OSB04_015369 [Centaurea solstitialis]
MAVKAIMEKYSNDVPACLEKLDELGWGIEHPLYHVATFIFSESVDYRKVWLSLKPEGCEGWVRMVGHKHNMVTKIALINEIRSATRDFDDELVIGEGGFGKVYKGFLRVGETIHVVAIKRLDPMSDQGAAEFKAEIEMLSELRHCHLVSLIGFCEHNKEMMLVYEYMSNGTLDHHLHKAETPLSWMQRLQIAKGAAKGLDYLHNGVGTQHGVIHRDIKSSNILLDENLAAKISDFGLSKIGPTNQLKSVVDTCSVKGTFGYMDLDYFYTRKLTVKTDVYAFGVLLFELLSGRKAVDERFGDQCGLAKWARKCVKDRKFDKLVESKIMGTMLKLILI